jgi:SAM-dependent methyltransferase
METLGNNDSTDPNGIPSPGTDADPAGHFEALYRLEREFGERLQRQSNEIYELKNIVLHLTGLVENGTIGIKNGLKHVAGLVENTSIGTKGALESVIQDVIVAWLGRLLAIEARLARGQHTGKPVTPRPRPHVTFESATELVRAEFPQQFNGWHQRFLAVERAMASSVIGNAANAGDPYSLAFKSFVELHARGTILDVGCGPLGRPFYLSSFNAQRLHGLEPVVQHTSTDMHIVRGMGECLPWEDKSFDTVISATSIDHVLSLGRCLSEMARVLVSGGFLLIWVGSIPGAPRYEPTVATYASADAFHLFHIDKTWFEPLLLEHFAIEDRVVLWRQSHEHVFYSLRLRELPSEGLSRDRACSTCVG